MEEWRSIEGHTDYHISSYGRIKGVFGKILNPYISKRGYYVVNLHLGEGKQIQKNIHRLVAETFLPNPNNLECVDHINRNRLDNNISNLRWVNKKENGINRPRGETGELYIYNTDCNTFRVSTPDGKQKRFKTLKDAIEFRDLYLNLTTTDFASQIVNK